MQNRTRRLWGQEIDVVKGGLDEGQVVDFVTRLMTKYRSLVERQQHYLSLGTLSEKAAIEADRLAADIKSRAKGEAEGEAGKIIAHANQRAQEMLASARKSAQEVTRGEAENLLEAAYRKANVIETEAKQRAQLFLIRARSVVEDDLKDQFSGIYDNLLSALRELLGEGHDVEAGWKGKLVELWKKETLELGAYEAVPSVLATEITQASRLGAAQKEAVVDIAQAELLAREEEVFFEATSQAEVASRVPPTARTTEAVDTAPARQVEVLPEEPPRTRFAEERPVEQTQETAGLQIQEPAVEAGYQEEPKVAFVAPEAELELQAEVKVPSAYQDEIGGEVDINLVAPVELSVMSKIYAELQGNPEVKILRTVGSYDKGTTITVILEKPTRLVDTLVRIPGVEVTSETTGKQGLFKKSAGGQDKIQGRVTIPLRTKR